MMDAYLGKRSLGLLTARLAGVVLLLASTSVLVAQARLPDTKPLLENGDLAVLMVDGIHRFLDHETEVVRTQRQRFWDVQKGRRADLVAAKPGTVSKAHWRGRSSASRESSGVGGDDGKLSPDCGAAGLQSFSRSLAGI